MVIPLLVNQGITPMLAGILFKAIIRPFNKKQTF